MICRSRVSKFVQEFVNFGGSIFQKAVHGNDRIPAAEFYKDNHAVYNYISGCMNNSANLLSYCNFFYLLKCNTATTVHTTS